MLKFIKSFGGREKYKSMKFKKDITSDCVARSISIAMDQDYQTTFVDLAMLSARLLEVPNTEKCYEVYLESKGWVKNKPMRNSHGKLLKLGQYPKTGTYLVNMSGHLAVVKEGAVYDVGDARYGAAYSYYTKGEK